jgi:ABC-2 type transport system permease protein
MNALNNKYALLVRRELWEHRALWVAPAIVAGAFVVIVLFAGERSMFAGLDRGGPTGVDVPALSRLAGQMVMLLVSTVLGGTACIATFAYLLDCLYAERKDRSILFWKSLPVSDTQTVLAKLAVALVLVPLMASLLAVIAQPLVLAAANLRFEALRPVIGFESLLGGLKTLPKLYTVWLFGVLWYAPFVTYLMLASVLSKRVPLMYAILPPGVLIMVEGLLLNSNNVVRFLGERFAPWIRDDWAWDVEHSPTGQVVGLGSPDWTALMQNQDLWLGLAAAAGMVYIVIRLRRYRDDT